MAATPLIEAVPGACTPQDFLLRSDSRDDLAQPALLRVRDWFVGLAHPVDVLSDLQAVADLAARIGWRDHRSPGPPFTGGMAGFLTDAAARDLLGPDGADARPAPAPLPGCWFGIYDTAVCWDAAGHAYALATELPGTRSSPARRRLERGRAWLMPADRNAPSNRHGSPGPSPLPDALGARTATPTLSQAEHARGVAEIRSWIAAGDLYQLNLTFHVRVPWPASGADLALRMWRASPDAAHASWLRPLDGIEIASISPETFLRTDADRVVVRPIKGTRPRAAEAIADQQEAQALRTSAKDRAEHVMIVDLERNDLGRVCVTGSVHVPELAALERHPTVWHLTSTVEGRLRDEVELDELLASTFPCGSVTGAPKRMAVSRLPRVEPWQRGVYCGTVGVVSHGLTDFSVAIRTAVLAGEVASYGTGGGIVADSDPVEEWREALDKAAAFLSATNAELR